MQRGKKHKWNPVDQFTARAWTHHVNGHPVDKIEILVLGGTWSEYPHEYQARFLRDIFYASNTFYDDEKRTPVSCVLRSFVLHARGAAVDSTLG